MTYKLLSEEGIGGVSIDEVSRRSGVSKTTIYRHWPSRSTLLLEACASIAPPAAVPDTGTLRDDLLALTTHLAQQLATARWPAVLPSIIDAAERDPEVYQLQARMHAGNLLPFVTVAERAKQRGELARGQNVADFVDAIIAPFFYRRWFARAPLDETFVRHTVANLLRQAKGK